MLSHLMIVKLRYIIYNQDFGEPKVAYDILSKELKNFVGSYLY
jgi:hypothetical protein